MKQTMKLTLDKYNYLQFEEVFNPIIFKTKDGEEMIICMRDSGFEFTYNGEPYFAKEGHLEPLHKSVRGNYLVEQKHIENEDISSIKRTIPYGTI